MRPSSPRSSRISSTTARYSRSSSRGLAVDGLVVGALLDLDAQAAVGAGVGGAGDAAVQAVERRRRGRRRAGGRCSATSATVPTFGELALVDAGRAARAPRRRRRRAASTSMVGKTTVSSSGMSSSVLI